MTLTLWFVSLMKNSGSMAEFFVEVTDKNLNLKFPLNTLTNPILVLG